MTIVFDMRKGVHKIEEPIRTPIVRVNDVKSEDVNNSQKIHLSIPRVRVQTPSAQSLRSRSLSVPSMADNILLDYNSISKSINSRVNEHLITLSSRHWGSQSSYPSEPVNRVNAGREEIDLNNENNDTFLTQNYTHYNKPIVKTSHFSFLNRTKSVDN
ncbi:unnamed protein product [Medioppia subpectinata]|uniref:Uncharacterized protein n=1 Tax=Medioppia subpectinata TaxID=1979941 RepID=A0A7R9L3A6_9ACAR|nr:unnamed protein product [Medioppia subpectinata]CAG2114780.1 unnamed protein product [Medioppia subpectinata]